MKRLFTGVCTALVTPFKKGNIDWRSFGRLINMQIEGGVSALLVLGTTGEASTITDNERQAIIAFAVEIIYGRVPLIVGAGGNDPRKIIEYSKQAKQLGASAVLISSPYYNKTTQVGLIKHFRHIAREIRFPIIVYNIPGRSGMNIDPQTMAEICRIKHVAGIKESSGNIEQMSEYIRLCPKTPVYCGDDTMALPSYATGALGIISVASNARPRDVAEIFVKFRQGRNITAKKLFIEQLPFYKSLFVQVNPIPIKRVLAEAKICGAEVRLPLVQD